MDLKVSGAALLSLLDAGITAEFFLGTIVHLYQNDVSPSADSVPADFDEATYTGYAPAVVTLLGTSYDDAGQACVEMAAVIFQPTGTAIPNVVYGYWLEGGGDSPMVGAFMGGARFDEPKTLASANDAKVVQPRFAIGFPVGVPG